MRLVRLGAALLSSVVAVTAAQPPPHLPRSQIRQTSR